MNTLRKSAALAAVIVTAGSLSGCAMAPKVLSFLHLRRSSPAVAIRSTLTPAEVAKVSPEDQLYQDAKRAIEARDYASALDLLQLAKQRSPNDSRVLNALGVLYDKLGRFDLSSRYYKQALAAHPDSPAVLANMQYSQKLQSYSRSLRGDEALQAAIEAPTLPAAALPKVQLAQAKPVLLGSAVRIVNASGNPQAAKGVRRRLAAAGWSVSADAQRLPVRGETVIRFGPKHRRVAEALARTLPFRSALEHCERDCTGIELVVGANVRGKRNS